MTTTALPYQGHLPFVAGSDTSQAAAESMAESSTAIRTRVLRYVRDCGPFGATCDEIELRLRLRHQTASARCRELVLMGLLEKHTDPHTGKTVRRVTRSGRAASVLYATHAAAES